jgi:hypothetical protein
MVEAQKDKSWNGIPLAGIDDEQLNKSDIQADDDYYNT